MADEQEQAASERAGADRYWKLPEPVRVEDTIASQEATPAPDPDGGRDPERDFMLRNAT